MRHVAYTLQDRPAAAGCIWMYVATTDGRPLRLCMLRPVSIISLMLPGRLLAVTPRGIYTAAYAGCLVNAFN